MFIDIYALVVWSFCTFQIKGVSTPAISRFHSEAKENVLELNYESKNGSHTHFSFNVNETLAIAQLMVRMSLISILECFCFSFACLVTMFFWGKACNLIRFSAYKASSWMYHIRITHWMVLTTHATYLIRDMLHMTRYGTEIVIFSMHVKWFTMDEPPRNSIVRHFVGDEWCVRVYNFITLDLFNMIPRTREWWAVRSHGDP